MSLEGLVGVREAPSVLRSIGIVPGKKYDPAEFQRLLTQSKANKLRVQGYVLRVDLEGKVSVVHWTKADDFQSTMRDEWRAHRQEPGKPMIDIAGGWDGSKKSPESIARKKTYEELKETLEVILKEALEFNRQDALTAAGSGYKEEKFAV